MMNPRDRRILVVTCFGHFMSHFNMLVFPAVVLPLAARLNMDMAQVGLPYTLKFLWSPFLDRFTLPFLGRRRGWLLIFQVALILSVYMTVRDLYT